MRKASFPQRARRLVLATGAALALVTAQAQPVDLLTAWRQATEHDATWQAAQATARAGQEVVALARAELRPNVSLSASRGHNEVTYSGSGAPGQNYYSGTQSLSLRQPLYRPALMARLGQAHAEARDVAARLDIERQDVMTRVTEAYFEVLLASDQVHMLQAQLGYAQVQIDAARKGRAAGSGTRTDEDEAVAKRDLLQAQVLAARQGLQGAQQNLQDLVQQPVAAVMGIAQDARLRLPGASGEPLAHWQDLATTRSHELMALQAQYDAARYEVTRARAAHRPTLDANLLWQRSDRDAVTSATSRYSQGQVSLQFNMPLYAGGGINAAVRQALAQQDRAEHAMEAARRDLSARVTREWRAVSEGQARISAFEQAVHSAQQLVHATQRSFQAGIRSNLDVLDAQDRLATARIELARARYLLLVASLRLAALAGTASEALLADINRQLDQPLALGLPVIASR